MSINATSKSYAWWILIILTLVGIALSAHLTYVHIGVYLIDNFVSGCNINQHFNCESVALSQYAVFLGVPTSIWGIIGYLFMLILSIIGLTQKHRQTSPVYAMLVLTTGFSITVGVVLAYLSHTQLSTICPTCAITYGISLLMFIFALLTLKTDHISISQTIISLFRWLPKNVHYMLLPVIGLVILMPAYPKYWEAGHRAAASGFKDMTRGVEKDHHWIGSRDPRVTIVEFADYQCPYCSIAHFAVRDLVRQYPNDIRLFHRHFPLDHNCNPSISRPFHPSACLMARAAYCAGLQQKFWPANDLLYKNGRKFDDTQLPDMMAKLGIDMPTFTQCMDSDKAHQAIVSDLQDGQRLGVQGTPFFFVNGELHKGGVEQLKQKIIDMLKQPRQNTSPR
jgi:protein-disulfide isomerase/uncharacterized membrane protein